MLETHCGALCSETFANFVQKKLFCSKKKLLLRLLLILFLCLVVVAREEDNLQVLAGGTHRLVRVCQQRGEFLAWRAPMATKEETYHVVRCQVLDLHAGVCVCVCVCVCLCAHS